MLIKGFFTYCMLCTSSRPIIHCTSPALHSVLFLSVLHSAIYSVFLLRVLHGVFLLCCSLFSFHMHVCFTQHFSCMTLDSICSPSARVGPIALSISSVLYFVFPLHVYCILYFSCIKLCIPFVLQFEVFL